MGIYAGSSSAEEYIEFFKQTPESVIPPPKHYDAMEGLEFEHFCADLLRKNGFVNVEVSRGSGDHGVDILAEKDEVTYAIQCKRSSSNIGNKAVQEIYSGRSFHNRHIGVVLTNQQFTSSAKEAAERKGILLWDREYLEKMIENAEQ
jgi:restriction system protein